MNALALFLSSPRFSLSLSLSASVLSLARSSQISQRCASLIRGPTRERTCIAELEGGESVRKA